LFTGRYGHVTGVESNGGQLDQCLPNLATGLTGAGYNIGYTGKWHVDHQRTPSEWGFRCKRDFPGYGYPASGASMPGLKCGPKGDSQVSRNYLNYLEEHNLEPPELLEAFYSSGNPGQTDRELHGLHAGTADHNFEALVAEEAVELLQGFAKEDNPFFVWANFWGPHSPCIVPEPYYSMYDPGSIPEDPSFRDTLENRPYAQTLVSRYWGIDPDNWGEWQEVVARYWGYVTMIDDLVGRMLGELEALGLQESTIVVMSTDHGDNMGAHKLFEKGPFFDEECFLLPFIASHPECERPGSEIDEFVYVQDLYPSFLEAAGLEPDSGPDTQSILRLLAGQEGPTGRDSVYCQFNSQIQTHRSRMVRTGTHKFVFSQSDTGELYDLVEDPHEMRNLFGVPEHRGIQESLMQRMQSHMERVGDPMLREFMRVRHIY